MPSLIVPLVSAGNVAQLCLDVILHSFGDEFQFVKDIDCTMLHPFLGPLDYVSGSSMSIYESCKDNKKYTTPLELFRHRNGELYVLQQRSPIIEGYENQFFRKIVIKIIEEYKIDSILILDSAGVFDSSVPISSSHYQTPFTLAECQIGSIDQLTSQLESGLHLNEQESSMISKCFSFGPESFQQSFSIYQQAYKLFFHLLHQPNFCLKKINYVSKLVQEGDNSWDALQLCDYLGEIIPSLKPNKLTTPVSWNGVYGARPPALGFEEGIYS